MTIDATFWVAVSFLIFIGVIVYLKVPQKIDRSLNESIKKIKDSLDNAEQLKDEAKSILSEYESKVSKSKEEIKNLIQSAKNQAEKNIIKTNEDFHNIIENRKKTAEEKIKQMKIQAIKDVKKSLIIQLIRKNSIKFTFQALKKQKKF